MPYSYVEYGAKSSGDTMVVSIPYLDREHISVLVDDVVVSATLWSWASDGLINCLASFPSGTVTRVQRSTPDDALEATLTGSAQLNWRGVNTNFLQSLYMTQERIDAELDVIAWAAQVAIDKLAVAADKATVAADKALVAADLALTNADVVLTHADVVLTHADVVSTGADVDATNADVVLTNADVVTAAAHVASALGYSNSASGFATSASGFADTALTYSNNASAYATTALGHANAASGFADAASASADAAAASALESASYVGAASTLGGYTPAQLLDRGNHTGSQLAATISDFSTAADARVSAALGVSVQAYSVVLASTTAAFTTAQETKLANIETAADVTDATNVAAAGALMAATADQTITGGARVTQLDLGNLSGTTKTPDPGDRPHQKITNNGAGTIAPGTNEGNYLLTVKNTTGAGAITTSGWSLVSGDAFGTATTAEYLCHCTVVGDYSVMSILEVTA